MDRRSALQALQNHEPMTWANEGKKSAREALRDVRLFMSMNQVIDAEARLRRFAPYLGLRFPETGGGIVESPLSEAPSLREDLTRRYDRPIPRLLLKRDNDLPIAGSIKARGGIHEILALAESLVIRSGSLSTGDDYSVLTEPGFRRLFSSHSVAVGSTGNLGISVGIMASDLGFRATVHMSRDAKEWKKRLLRSRGVTVVEHDDDYSSAVQAGRRAALEDPSCHFVDDESSPLLFTGYAVAALRLRAQLSAMGVAVDERHPLRVYLPCGVGGAPGGIAYGLKQLYGDAAHCWFVEPTHAPCMALAMILDRPDIRVSDYGIDGLTEADGLAVSAPSELVWTVCRHLVDGVVTLNDRQLYRYQYLLHSTESVVAEPSAAAGLHGVLTCPPMPGETAVTWLTGGRFLPKDIYAAMIDRGKVALALAADETTGSG